MDGMVNRDMIKPIKIGEKWVGPGHPCFIIAEAGVNHNGDVDRAYAMVDVAADVGVDAIKFQTFRTEALVTSRAQSADYQAKATGEENQFALLKSLELGFDDFSGLAEHAEEKGVIFLATPFDDESALFLNDIGVPAFKISSGDVSNLPFLERISTFAKPMILSTGMATLGEVEAAVNTIRNRLKESLVLLHCVSDYPANPADANLRAMATMEKAFHVSVGFSDHTPGIAVAVAAVGLGACIVEKHFTLDRTLPGPDHEASLEPGELKALVSAARMVESALGDGVKRPTPRELETACRVRRSIVSARAVKAGEVLTMDDLALKRPGIGLQPSMVEEVIGKRSRRDLQAGELLKWSDLQ